MDFGVLGQKKCFVLDMDGTFYLENSLIPGSLDFIAHLGNTGRDFVFFTNNTSKNAQFYLSKLEKLGCPVSGDKLITAAMVTIEHIRKTYGNPRIYLLGTPFLENDFRNSGLSLVENGPDIVVAGFDTTVTYEKLRAACAFIRNGTPFIATHPDFNCPVKGGFMPDCGAICAFITASTGIRPKVLGKPNIETLDFILKYTGCARDELAFTGDRLYTDIAIGAKNGVASILVLTGETRIEDLENSDVKPDFVFGKLADMIEHLK